MRTSRLRSHDRRHLLRSRSGLGDAARAVHRLDAGFGCACFRITIACYAKSIEIFNYVVSAVITPLFLLAGSFFPLDQLPRWAQALAQLNPLHHYVELVRHGVFGLKGWEDLARVGALFSA